jgi:hypothetical protein
MTEELENLKNTFKDLKAVIIIEDRKIVLSEFDQAKSSRLLHIVCYMLAAIKEKSEFERILIEAENGSFCGFYQENRFLGFFSREKVNFPLLKFMVRKTFAFTEPEIQEEVDTIEERVRKFF